MQPWRTLSRRSAFKHPPFLEVELHQVADSEDGVIDDWTWIVTPDYVNVFVETQQGRYLCFRQIKYAVGGTSLAPVGGFVEPGEAPETAARRELLEETGYEAAEWFSLGSFAVDANRGVGRAHFFLARNAKSTMPPRGADRETHELLFLTYKEMENALAAGEFKVLPWAAIVALGLRFASQPTKQWHQP